MDVRCERCDTEYELEDDAVSEGGAPVQCTSCGHTFFVTRTTGERPAVAAEAELPAADWLLETSDGQLHRFRNLTSLQKWIIERKVTREDKISRTGHAWRRLGEIVELAPFFDVVDQADRARAAEAAARELKVEAEHARRAGPRPTPARGTSVPESSPRRSTPVSPRPPSPVPPPPAAAIDAIGFTGEHDTHVVALRRRSGTKAMAFILVTGAVAGVGFYLFRKSPERPATATASVSRPAPAPPRLPPEKVAPTPAPAPSPPPAPVPAPAPVAAAIPGAVPIPIAMPSPAAPPAAASPATSAAPAAAPAEPAAPSYDRLITEADRLLENGKTDRAAKLYEQALKLDPSGVDAMTGLGYASLDRGRVPLALSFFKKALAQAPSFAPAVFGLAEAHRAGGADADALENYKRYVALSPTGPEVHAAQRQIQAIEARKRASDSKPDEPTAPTNQAPASPSSVLGESARSTP